MDKTEQRETLKEQSRPGMYVIILLVVLAILLLAGYFIGTYAAGGAAAVVTGDAGADIGPIEYKVDMPEGQ